MPYVMDEKGNVKRVSPPIVGCPPKGSNKMKRKVKELYKEAIKQPVSFISFKQLVKEVGSLEELIPFSK